MVGRFDPGTATFMHMRTPEFHVEPRAVCERDRGCAEQRTTTLDNERLWENSSLWFFLHLAERGRIGFGYAMDPSSGEPGPVFFCAGDSSWCELSPPGEGNVRQVWEGGPRRLWSSIEARLTLWRTIGEPAWDRFGLTVRSDAQWVWLDDPASTHRWRLHP